MNIEVLVGDEADRLIRDGKFREQWRRLYKFCPWRTIFQSEDFVVTWYETYKEKFTPVIVIGTNQQPGISGLFMLAIEKESGRLVVAGTNNAEYHTWLSIPDDGDIFIESALQHLAEKFPNKTLLLLFAPPDVPLEWVRAGKRWANQCSLRPHTRGLVTIGDGSSFRDTLRKKKQNKINRLKRLGNLHLDRLRSPEELEAVFDEILCYQTLRMRAIYNLRDIPEDPLKKRFYLNLMRLPGMIHATILRLDYKLVSAQIHNYNNDQVLLGLITHAPFYAKFSPGELHVLMLSAELGEEGVPIFDLTPGGDYKDRYATHHDEAYALEIFLSRAQYHRYRIKRSLIEFCKLALKPFGVTFDQAKGALASMAGTKDKWANLKTASLPFELFNILRKKFWNKEEFLVFAYDLKRADDLPDERQLRKDHVPDLLIYRPTEPWQPEVNKFFKYSLDSFGAGNHVYTYSEGEMLVHYSWLIEDPSQPTLAGVEAGLDLASDSALIADFHTHPQMCRKGLSRASLTQMIRDAAKLSGRKMVYICVPENKSYLKQVVEEAGFSYQYTHFRKTRFGKMTCWNGTVKAGDQTHVKSVPVVPNAMREPAD
jgi:CelD/BcsL family acetyltransferase involved in cellulose biosynthesis